MKRSAKKKSDQVKNDIDAVNMQTNLNFGFLLFSRSNVIFSIGKTKNNGQTKSEYDDDDGDPFILFITRHLNGFDSLSPNVA